MDTVTLHKDGDFIIVDAGSDKEKELMANGWKKDPARSRKQPVDTVASVNKE